MSVSIGNLFNFARSLPEPFDKLTNKKVKISSKYGSGTEATLCCTMIKAVHAVCNCMTGTGEGAVGSIDHRTVAEYKSSAGPDSYHLVVFDSGSGNIMASVYDKNTEAIENYKLHQSDKDGAAVMMAMMPLLLKDGEFDEYFQTYFDQRNAGYPDMKKATDAMAILCDNAYRRINDDTCPAHIKVTLEKSGNVMRVSQSHLLAGVYTPNSILAGEFTIFAKTGKVTVSAARAAIDHKDFVGKYQLTSTRKLSVLEETLVPKLEEWYIIPDEIVDICKHALNTTGKPMQMRNFLLRGPAGTGKTQGARAIAAGLHLPYMKYTCSASTEVFDFVGMVFPKTDSMSTGDAELDKQREILQSMGGINYANVAKIMNLPDLDDMDYDPAGTFQSLTGVENDDATSRDCMAVVMDMVTEKIKALTKPVEKESSSGQSYTYVETDFIKALKHGYVVEIQEPTVITQPGVLVGLNSLLEQTGSITLPTGEIIQRHPDTVVVVTTNITYEGCRGLNQSVVDRMSLVEDIELPAPEVMVQRAMAVTGATDEYMVSQMVQVVNDMSEYMRKNGITDGTCGMRSLIDWVTSTEITGDPYRSALCTIISKATSDEEDRETLKAAILEPIFAPKRRKAS
ncbi:MAG: ATP-binding protein [Oscillospiraceae bacterium]|nr:ATP-binding protein [Oscillospiraceae bacterium]